MDDKNYKFEEALEFAKNNTVVMGRVVDCDGFDILKKWFIIDDEGNIKSREFWFNNYPGSLTINDIFSDKYTNCILDKSDYEADNWTIEDIYLR